MDDKFGKKLGYLIGIGITLITLTIVIATIFSNNIGK